MDDMPWGAVLFLATIAIIVIVVVLIGRENACLAKLKEMGETGFFSTRTNTCYVQYEDNKWIDIDNFFVYKESHGTE